MGLNEHMKFPENDGIIFNGDKMTILIDKMYEKHRLIHVARTVKTIGIFEYKIGDNDKFHGVFLPGIIEIEPSEINFIKDGNKEFIKLTLYKGDYFMKTRKIIKNEQLAYVCFALYYEDGKMPSWIPYEKRSFIFDTLKHVTGISFPVDHTVFEVITAHLTRCKSDIFKEFRFSDDKRDILQLKLKDVAHASNSFTARSIGGNLADSINVSLTHKNTESSDIEELLRGNR